MESMWFYVLCFYIWRTFGKFMFISSSFPRGCFQLDRRNVLYLRRNSIQKTTEKNLSVQNAWLRKEKTHAAAHILQICTLSEKKSA